MNVLINKNNFTNFYLIFTFKTIFCNSKLVLVDSMNKVISLFSVKNICLILSISLFFSISAKKLDALPHEWISVPRSEYGEQLWDRKSIKRNKDGSVRVLSKFIPKTKSEITQDILYTMDINCFEKSFRDVDVSTDEESSNLNNFASWQDPNGDSLILDVIGQVCRIEN